MGKTRSRVTRLVLSLEVMGLMMLAAAAFLAGGQRLTCERQAVAGSVDCVAEDSRLLWLLTWQRQSFRDVRTAVAERPAAIGRDEHWLSLSNAQGQRRVLGGTRESTAQNVAALSRLIDQSQPGRVRFDRSATPWAMLAALFGFLWLLVISLIMREFLGYHTPWWLRLSRRWRNRGADRED